MSDLPTLYVHADYLSKRWADAGRRDVTAWLLVSEDSGCVAYVPASRLAAAEAERDELRRDLARVTAERDEARKALRRIADTIPDEAGPHASLSDIRFVIDTPDGWHTVDMPSIRHLLDRARAAEGDRDVLRTVLGRVESDLSAARQERDALRALLREAADRLLDDAALLHRTGMTSESTKHARAADEAREMAARIAAAIGSG